jgi:hypothetical protein
MVAYGADSAAAADSETETIGFDSSELLRRSQRPLLATGRTSMTMETTIKDTDASMSAQSPNSSAPIVELSPSAAATASSVSSPAEDLTVDADKRQPQHRSKWGKLRQTVKATTVFASAAASSSWTAGGSSSANIETATAVGCKVKKQRPNHNNDASRRDSFLERFSTRQSACSTAAMSSSGYIQQHCFIRRMSESMRESESDAKVDLPHGFIAV